MADKSTQLMLEALSRAVAEPTGLPLYGSKAAPGLFAATAPARQAAEKCKEEGYLHVIRVETRGKSQREVCAITEKGLAWLLEQVSPRQVLEQLVQGLEARNDQVNELVAAARQSQASLDTLKVTIQQVLSRLQQPTTPPAAAAAVNGLGQDPSANGSETWLSAVVHHLADWQAHRQLEDCPLPELYRRARRLAPALTVGHFHDGIRRLHEQQLIYLHPWTGPLYEIPEPALALMVGHEIAYYVSKR